jgi:hypothetical protein
VLVASASLVPRSDVGSLLQLASASLVPRSDVGSLLPLAHGIGGRSDLPVPLWLAVYGGAIAVLISFFALVAFWPEPKLRGERAGRPWPARLQRLADATATRMALRALGLLLGAVVLAVAWLGLRSASQNPAPTWFYVWFWVGLVPASVLFGPVWRLLNPLRTVVAVLRATVFARVPTAELPARVGYWPAVAGLAAFVWMELVYDKADLARTVALFLTVYAVVHVAFGVAYGQRWFDKGDGFEVYSSLLAHLAPLGRRVDGRLVLRNPLNGLASLRPAPGLVVLVSVLLGSTAFDGVTRTRIWVDLTFDADRPLYLAVGTAGLLLAIQFILGTYTAAMWLTRRHAPPEAAVGIEGRFVHSLIPIAVGYTVAHYFSFAVFQGQAGILLAADPLGRGWRLFDTDAGIDYTVVSPQAIALVQVAAIVIGHIVGVVAAHDRAVSLFDRTGQRAGQYPLLALMVTYTCAGIALLVGT